MAYLLAVVPINNCYNLAISCAPATTKAATSASSISTTKASATSTAPASTTISASLTTGGSISTTGASASTAGGSISTTGASASTASGSISTTGASATTAGGSITTTGASATTAGGSISTTGASASTAGGSTSTIGGDTSTTDGSTSTSGGSTSTTQSSNSTCSPVGSTDKVFVCYNRATAAISNITAVVQGNLTAMYDERAQNTTALKNQAEALGQDTSSCSAEENALSAKQAEQRAEIVDHATKKQADLDTAMEGYCPGDADADTREGVCTTYETTEPGYKTELDNLVIADDPVELLKVQDLDSCYQNLINGASPTTTAAPTT